MRIEFDWAYDGYLKGARLVQHESWEKPEEVPALGTTLFILIDEYTTESTFNPPTPQRRVHSWYTSFPAFEAAKATAVSAAEDDYFDKHVRWGIEVATLQGEKV